MNGENGSIPTRRLVVIAGYGQIPSEEFIHRDLKGLEGNGWEWICFGLNQRHLKVEAILKGSLRRENIPAWVRPSRINEPRKWGLSWSLSMALVAAGAKLWHRPRQVVALLRSWRLIVAVVMAAGEADLILAHFAWLTADIAAIASRVTGCPWVCGVHAWDVFTQAPPMVERRLRTAALVIGCNQAALNAVQSAGVNAGRTTLIYHGLSVERVSASGHERPTNGIVAAGRLEPKKGFDILLEALARLEGSRYSLDLAGEGSCRHELEKLAFDLGIGERVRFHGHLGQNELFDLLEDSSIFVLPSRRMPDGDRDGIANVLLEAMSFGLPVITTTAGAASEIIQDGENGILISPDDIDALVVALTSLLADPELRGRLGMAGRETVGLRFDAVKVANQLSVSLAAVAEVDRL